MDALRLSTFLSSRITAGTEARETLSTGSRCDMVCRLGQLAPSLDRMKWEFNGRPRFGSLVNAFPKAVSSPFDLISRFDKVYVNFGRAKHLLRLEDVKFAHQIDQRLRRTLITLQGLVHRDLDHSFRKGYLALLPLHPDRDRLQQRCHKVGRGPCAARPAFGIARGFALLELVVAWRLAVTDS
jgi:hypothetical protein